MHPASVPPEALRISFFQFCARKQLPAGWVHEKNVPYTIIAQPINGHYEVSFQGRSSVVKAPHAFLVPPNTPLRTVHHADREGCFIARWLHLSCTLFHAIDLAQLLVMPRHIEGAVLKHLDGMFEDALGLPHSLAHAAGMHEAAWRMVRLLFEVSQPGPEADRLLNAGERLQPLLAHLNLNLAEKISVTDMARISGMSDSRLFAFFRKHLGCTPQNYLKRLRLEAAAAQLVSGDDSLKEIASRSGFANPFHLSREFHRRFGASPKLYRRLNVRTFP